MKLIPVLAALSLSAVAVVPAAAQDVTIETYTGEVSVPAGPASIVALDVAAVDTLDALGVSLAGVPSNLFVDYLDHVSAEAVGVGTLFEPDYEALANLGPDLIVAGAGRRRWWTNWPRSRRPLI